MPSSARIGIWDQPRCALSAELSTKLSSVSLPRRSVFNGRCRISPIRAEALIKPLGRRQSLAFRPQVSAISSISRFVESISSSAIGYIPFSPRSHIASTAAQMLPIDVNERLFSNAAKGHGKPRRAMPQRRFKLPLLPGP